MPTTITVESCLAELREMFPQFKSRIITFYDPDPGVPYTSVVLSVDDDHDPALSFMRFTLGEVMDAIRAWKSQRND